MLRIGLISDTHGLLRPEAVAVLAGCDHIIHGGDIGSESILQQLTALAPVSAVRGNNDTGHWAQALPETLLLQLGAAAVYVIHDLAQIDLRREAVAAVVSGHSHQPLIREQDGILYVNPGSAGPRRFKLPIAVGELQIDGQAVSARIVELPITGGAKRPATRSRRAAS